MRVYNVSMSDSFADGKHAAGTRLGELSHADRRPVPEPARAPLGGAVTRMPGRNAAAVILNDLGASLEEVVSKKS
jgi:hypothetical protein